MEAFVRWGRLGDPSHVILMGCGPVFLRALDRGIRQLIANSQGESERGRKEGAQGA